MNDTTRFTHTILPTRANPFSAETRSVFDTMIEGEINQALCVPWIGVLTQRVGHAYKSQLIPSQAVQVPGLSDLVIATFIPPSQI